MTAKTSTERVNETRARRKALGMQRVEVYLSEARAVKLKALGTVWLEKAIDRAKLKEPK
jgi:hypothetical protein